MEVKIEKTEKTVTATGENNTTRVTGTVIVENDSNEMKSANVQFYDVADNSYIGHCSMTGSSMNMSVTPITKNIECCMAFNEYLMGVQGQM
jgi:hypothetical protein